jgi:hypothetical protein
LLLEIEGFWERSLVGEFLVFGLIQMETFLG